MRVVYEVPIREDYKFTATVDEEKKTVSISNQYRSVEGWLFSAGEEIVVFFDGSSRVNSDIREAIRRAFDHFV